MVESSNKLIDDYSVSLKNILQRNEAENFGECKIYNKKISFHQGSTISLRHHYHHLKACGSVREVRKVVELSNINSLSH